MQLEKQKQPKFVKTVSQQEAWEDQQEDEQMALVHQGVSSFVKRILPNSILLREFNGNFVFQVPAEHFDAEKLFIEMEKNKQRMKIADWGIS